MELSPLGLGSATDVAAVVVVGFVDDVGNLVFGCPHHPQPSHGLEYFLALSKHTSAGVR